jgi:hypothetical protein
MSNHTRAVEVSLHRYRALFKYLCLYKFIRDYQMRKKVQAIHSSLLVLVGTLLKEPSVRRDTVKQSEIEAWYANSAQLAKHFTGSQNVSEHEREATFAQWNILDVFVLQQISC